MKIPLFPLDVVLFPGEALPLHIFEERYKEMIGLALANHTEFGVVRAQREGLAVIGTTAAIVRVLQTYADGRMDVLCGGRRRFEIEVLDNSRAFLQAEVDFIDDDGPVAPRELREECAALHCDMVELMGLEPSATGPDLNQVDLNRVDLNDTDSNHIDLNRAVSMTLAAAVPADLGFKQDLLGLRSDTERTKRLIAFYKAMLPKLRRGVQATRIAARNGHVM